jgi:hypothetical protein
LTPSTSYSFRILGYNTYGNSATSNVAVVSTPSTVPALNFTSGFAASKPSLTYNGSAGINGTNAQLTSGAQFQAGSVFSTTAVNVTSFTTAFQFQFNAGANTADGLTFTIQGNSPAALGADGGGLGYSTDGSSPGNVIGNSVAIKFDLYSTAGNGPDSTGLYVNGASPAGTASSVDMTSSGVNLHSGDIFLVTMTYNGTTLAVTITDTVTGKSDTQNYAVNIPSYAGSTAYVGFTGGTGGLTSTTNILNWTFTPGVA